MNRAFEVPGILRTSGTPGTLGNLETPGTQSSQASLADLGRGQVHLHHISLDQFQDPSQQAGTALIEQTNSLNAHELQRSAGFLHALDRQHFITARWSLRALLGGYLSLAPAEVPLTVTPTGKPTLSPPHHDLHFNLSHTGGRALLAATLGRSLGIDLETVVPLPEVLGVAARVCTDRELTELRSVSAQMRTAVFYRLWTRREAALKALGTGLGGPPEQVEVDGGSARSAWLRVLGGSPESAASALATDLDVSPGLQAALVVCDGAALQLRLFSFVGTGPRQGHGPESDHSSAEQKKREAADRLSKTR